VKALLIPLLLLPALAAADVEPIKTALNNNCSSYLMCDNETGTDECLDAFDQDEIVLTMGRHATYTLYSTRTTAANYSCDIWTNKTGFDASVADSTQTDQVNTASITDEAPVYTMVVLLHKLWVDCTVNSADTSIIIEAVVCPRN